MSEHNTVRDVIYVVGGLLALRMLTSAYVNSAALSAQAQASAAQSQSDAAATSSIAGNAAALLNSIIQTGNSGT
jgi:hypothetical protein